MTVLPMWNRGNRPLSVPISRGTRLQLPSPSFLLLTLLLLCLYLRPPFSGMSLFAENPRGTYTPSPFRIPTFQFLPPPPEPTRPDYLPPPSKPKKKGMKVPNAVHYVYGLKPPKDGGDRGDELPYFAYLAMRSAILNLKPEKIYFHYQYLPSGPWWDLIAPNLELIKTQAPDEVHGRKISHFAHKADVLRLLAMKWSGGIYLDIDVFVIKSFDDLLYYETTLGMEASPDSRRHALDPEGLCNAIIISAPNSTFIDRWIESYATFDEHVWAHHSVVVPWEIARRHPDEVQVLSERAFFWPMWHGEEIQYTHERDDHDFHGTGQYAYHAWESLAMKYLSKLSPKSIREENNSFNRMVRPFIGPNDDEVYEAWQEQSR